MLVVELWHSLGPSSLVPGLVLPATSSLPPSLCYSGNGGDKAGPTDGKLWIIKLPWCHRQPPACPPRADGKGWLTGGLPTQIHFMSSILTSARKYSTFTGTESKVLFPSYIQPGPCLVFKTCQFCFYEEIISISSVECWLFRWATELKFAWLRSSVQCDTHNTLSRQTLNNSVIIRHNTDFCKKANKTSWSMIQLTNTEPR